MLKTTCRCQGRPALIFTETRIGSSPDVAGVGESAAQAAVDGIVCGLGGGHLEHICVVVDCIVAVELVLGGIAVHHQVLQQSERT